MKKLLFSLLSAIAVVGVIFSVIYCTKHDEMLTRKNVEQIDG